MLSTLKALHNAKQGKNLTDKYIRLGQPTSGQKPYPAASKGGSWGGRGGARVNGAAKISYATSSVPPTSKTAPATSTLPPPGTVKSRDKSTGSHRGQHVSRSHNCVLPAPKDCPQLVDIGANLVHRDFRSDLPALLERAKLRNVRPIMVTGTSVRSSEQAVTLCNSHEKGLLYSTAGVHPHDAKSCDEKTIPTLRSLVQKNECVVAIGECGLDFDRNFSEPTVQEKWFSEQLKLAIELKKPLFLHERSAHARFVEILKAHQQIGLDLSTCVVHCFTGNATELKAYLELGVFIGVTGWVTNLTKGTALREAVKLIPLDRIMIETDAPFLAPRNGKDEQGRRVRLERNEPELLHLVLQELAECMGVSSEELAKASTENALRFFGVQTSPTATNSTEKPVEE